MNTRRLRGCVERWPDAETGEYNPHCCRFPKSCSATVYDADRVTDEDLEPEQPPINTPGVKSVLLTIVDNDGNEWLWPVEALDAMVSAKDATVRQSLDDLRQPFKVTSIKVVVR